MRIRHQKWEFKPKIDDRSVVVESGTKVFFFCQKQKTGCKSCSPPAGYTVNRDRMKKKARLFSAKLKFVHVFRAERTLKRSLQYNM